jgi:hypothetical protein
MPFYAEYVSEKHTINSSLQLYKIQETYTFVFHLFYCLSVPTKQNEYFMSIMTFSYIIYSNFCSYNNVSGLQKVGCSYSVARSDLKSCTSGLLSPVDLDSRHKTFKVPMWLKLKHTKTISNIQSLIIKCCNAKYLKRQTAHAVHASLAVNVWKIW